ncbi:MAG: hypothetical protein HN952_06840 [Candidatus Cloacimonetes bacterium]|jgi:hypothetical protein|nr:hypothetical protein [Candidatus Cloacimonadota bacterium]MBT6994650.1 hypothetical protein [Candidatus Cloacimonadota bacterium]MBT7468782.1 hypothetical protein [Candidatus Cloacimonadota bacterium]
MNKIQQVTFMFLGIILCLCGTFMITTGGLKGNIQIQAGGIVMYLSSMVLFFAVRLSKTENRIKELESKINS